jgi:CBS domain-containing protein
MRIIDIPEYQDRKQLFTMEQSAPLVEAVKKMKERKYGSVIVTDKGKLCGIFTERDLLNKVVAEDIDIHTLKLRDIMTQNVQTAHVEDNIYDSMERMTKGRFRHLPVIDDAGELIGMVSQGDFVAISWQQLFTQLKDKTKASFFTFTQIWMLILGVVGYSILIFLLFYWMEK